MVRHNNFLQYLFLLVVIATSGFPSFMGFKFYIILFMPLLILYYSKYRSSYGINISNYVLFFLFFFILHGVLGHLSFLGVSEITLRYITLLLGALFIGKDFLPKYINIMVFFSGISIVFWLLISLSSSIHYQLLALGSVLPQFLSDNWIEHSTNLGTSLYVVYIPSRADYFMGMARNCGPFYEPGLFASFLGIALVFNINRTRKLFITKNIILLIAILSTFSSAGYVTLLITLIYYSTLQESHSKRFLLFVLTGALAFQAYNLDFMGEKIQDNYESDKVSSRFAAFEYHMEKLQYSPIVGFAGGAWPRTSLDAIYGTDNQESFTTPNGISYALTFWGIPLGILFFVYVFRAISFLCDRCNNRKKDVRWIFLVIMSLCFSQTITVMPLFILFTALSINKKYGY